MTYRGATVRHNERRFFKKRWERKDKNAKTYIFVAYAIYFWRSSLYWSTPLFNKSPW
jgi:hypothetical protein